MTDRSVWALSFWKWRRWWVGEWSTVAFANRSFRSDDSTQVAPFVSLSDTRLLLGYALWNQNVTRSHPTPPSYIGFQGSETCTRTAILCAISSLSRARCRIFFRALSKTDWEYLREIVNLLLRTRCVLFFSNRMYQLSTQVQNRLDCLRVIYMQGNVNIWGFQLAQEAYWDKNSGKWASTGIYTKYPQYMKVSFKTKLVWLITGRKN